MLSLWKKKRHVKKCHRKLKKENNGRDQDKKNDNGDNGRITTTLITFSLSVIRILSTWYVIEPS